MTLLFFAFSLGFIDSPRSIIITGVRRAANDGTVVNRDSGRQRPVPTPANDETTWVTSSDYPVTAMRENREGVSALRLFVGTNGKIAGCMIAVSSGHSDLDTAACGALKRRARFIPAHTEDGKAVTSTYYRRVRWVLPINAPVVEPDDAFSYAIGTVVRFHLTHAGEVESCSARTPQGPLLEEVRAQYCAQIGRYLTEDLRNAVGPSGRWIEFRNLTYVYDNPPLWQPLDDAQPPEIGPPTHEPRSAGH